MGDKQSFHFKRSLPYIGLHESPIAHGYFPFFMNAIRNYSSLRLTDYKNFHLWPKDPCNTLGGYFGFSQYAYLRPSVDIRPNHL